MVYHVQAYRAKGSLERAKAKGYTPSIHGGKAAPQVSQDRWEVVAIAPIR